MASQLEWDNRWLHICKDVASWSKDESTKCGCVFVDSKNRLVSLGYNGLPRGMNYDDRSLWVERPEKYFWMEHSERNAIYNAQRALEGCVAYITGPPCMDCGRAMVQVGIKRIVIPFEHNMGQGRNYIERWKESCLRAEGLFGRTGVEYVALDDNGEYFPLNATRAFFKRHKERRSKVQSGET